jgi:ABC-type bacteriocin/lantibiotic exporter with double-glycine peptidase domain
VYIYIYAVVVGLISLVLPLGIQAIIGMISGGLVFSSVIVLISVIIVAVLASGGLQIMQITLVEVLQQRIFAKAAFEFAFRVPKIRVEAWQKYYPPELMNRFFDVLNIQKSLPKILVELSGAILQILFGLILLSFYHPLFLAFAILLVTIVMVILYLTGPKGLQTSLSESKYKYKTVNWLEQLARNFNSFRLAGDTNLHMEKMEDNVKNYLYYRSSHFSILRSQMVYIVLFKTFIISGLLILGTVLVVDRQITLGQFVASEVIVVLVVAAVEKIIFSMETIYDLLTALEKVGNVTDLPLEKNRGVKVKMNQYPNGLHLSVRKLNYNYPNSGKYALNDVSFEVQPGERICIAGTYAAGKHTLGKIMAGVMGGYEGSIAVNGVSLRDIHANTFRTVVDNNLFYRDLFEGTILENIALSRTRIQYEDIWWAINKVGLSDFVNSQPEGLYTMLGLEGKQPSESIRHKIILARCVASKPKLLVFNDDLSILQRWEREQIISFLTHPDNPWTLLVISKNPAFMQACDKILLMDNNTIVAQGTYNELESHAALRETVLQ